MKVYEAVAETLNRLGVGTAFGLVFVHRCADD